MKMKKSEAYHIAQIAVITSQVISPEIKVEVLRELIDKEEVALFVEKQEEENATL